MPMKTTSWRRSPHLAAGSDCVVKILQMSFCAIFCSQLSSEQTFGQFLEISPSGREIRRRRENSQISAFLSIDVVNLVGSRQFDVFKNFIHLATGILVVKILKNQLFCHDT